MNINELLIVLNKEIREEVMGLSLYQYLHRILGLTDSEIFALKKEIASNVSVNTLRLNFIDNLFLEKSIKEIIGLILTQEEKKHGSIR